MLPKLLIKNIPDFAINDSSKRVDAFEFEELGLLNIYFTLFVFIYIHQHYIQP